MVAIVLAGILISYSPLYFGLYSEFFLFLFAGAIAGVLPTAQIKAAAGGFPDVTIVGLYCFITGLMTTDSITGSQFAWLFACLGFYS